jgi:hypothetical protein
MDEAAPLLLCLDWYGTCVPAKEMWTTVPYQISELCIQVGKEPRCAFVKLKTGKHCTFNRNSWTAVHGNKNRLIPACVRSALQYLLCSRPPGSKLRSPAQSSDGDTAYERHRPGRRRRHRPAVRRREGAPRSLGGRQDERERQHQKCPPSPCRHHETDRKGYSQMPWGQAATIITYY